MKFLIITHAVHGFKDKLFCYGPYVREMNVWTKYADEVCIVAPVELSKMSSIDLEYDHKRATIIKIPSINFQNISNSLSSIYNLPLIFFRIFKEMKSADHIHLRCPGNIGMLGCIVQIFFPNKKKSAKYAGNWDPLAKQPLSYKIQKWILSNSFLSRNMTVLVYGKWPNQTENIKSFFTATYSEYDKIEVVHNSIEGTIRFLFVGALSEGKRPLYALKLIEMLYRRGADVRIDFYGEGAERKILEQYIADNKLEALASLYGNQEEGTIRMAYQDSHFLILASKSEGWPKAVAEAMFWGVVPIASAVSCVPDMLNFGERGILLKMVLENDYFQISYLISNVKEYEDKSLMAQQWSRKFTLDLFDNKIQSIIK